MESSTKSASTAAANSKIPKPSAMIKHHGPMAPGDLMAQRQKSEKKSGTAFLRGELDRRTNEDR